MWILDCQVKYESVIVSDNKIERSWPIAAKVPPDDFFGYFSRRNGLMKGPVV